MKRIIVGLVSTLASAAVVACGGGAKSVNHTSAVASTPAPTVKAMPPGHIPSPEQAREYYSFGHLASDVETQAVAPLVKRYYMAAAADDGQAACRLMYARWKKAVIEDVERGNNCAQAMTSFFKRHPGWPTTDLRAIEVTSLRIKGSQGIALLRSQAMRSGEIVLHREGRAWRIQDDLGKYLP